MSLTHLLCFYKAPPQYMPAPAAMTGVPPGLEYLSQIDQLLVNQQIELLESKCGETTFSEALPQNLGDSLCSRLGFQWSATCPIGNSTVYLFKHCFVLALSFLAAV